MVSRNRNLYGTRPGVVATRFRTLGLELLEDRSVPANLTLTSIQLVDTNNNPVDSPVLGEQVFVRADFLTQDLDSWAQYTIDYSVDGVTLSSAPITVGAGSSGTQSGYWYLGGWFATAGSHNVVVTLNPDNAVSESDTSDNSASFSFSPHSATDLPARFQNPLGGTPFEDWTISNYLDRDPRANSASDFAGGPYEYDGHYGHDISPSHFGAQDAGLPVYAAAAGVVTQVVDGYEDRHTSWEPTNNQVDIDLGNGWVIRYFHMATNTLTVAVGDTVRPGQVLGLVGSSGYSTGVHLHFQVEHNGAAVETSIDPTTYWINPLPYQGDIRSVTDMGLTTTDPSSTFFERPADIDTINQAAGQRSFAWFIGNTVAGDALNFRWYRPDGSLYYDANFTSVENRGGYYYASTWLPDTPDAGTWTVRVVVNGVELARRTFEVTADGSAAIGVMLDGAHVANGRTTPLDFGSAWAGDTGPQRTFTVHNRGTANLSLSPLTLPPGFTLVSGPASDVAPGTSTTFTIALDTFRSGLKLGEILFTTNDPRAGVFRFDVSGEVYGTPSSGTPTVTLPGPAAQYSILGPSVAIAPGALVSDSNSPTFNGGSLIVELAAGGVDSDRLTVGSKGSIGVSGSTVTFSGTAIGTIAGGAGLNPLVITLNANASLAALQALVRAVNFGSVSTTPETAQRIVRFTLVDPTGLVSNLATKKVVVASNQSVSVANPDGTNSLKGATVASLLVPYQGIGVVGSSGNGSWEYSQDGGVSWFSIGFVSTSSARLLSETDRVRFLPGSTYSGGATLTFHAWDQTGYSAGETVDLTGSGVTGSGTAFSIASITVSVVEGLVTLHGTHAVVSSGAGADTLGFTAGASHKILVNGVAYTFAANVAQSVSFDGQTGSDLINVTGSSGVDQASLGYLSGKLTGQGYTVTWNNVETVYVHSGGGADTARLQDTVGTDVFQSRPEYAYMLSGSAYINWAVGFSKEVYASSTAGGTDYAYLFDSAGNDSFGVSTAYGFMQNANGPIDWAVGFDNVYGYSLFGGQDRANLYDSAGNDVYQASASYAYLQGTAFINWAVGFAAVYGYRSAGGADVAYLFDGVGNDVFQGSAAYSYLQGTGFINWAVGFGTVNAFSVSGADSAYLFDSPWNDTFAGSGVAATLAQGSGQTLATSGFDVVYAYGINGGINSRSLGILGYLYYELGYWV